MHYPLIVLMNTRAAENKQLGEVSRAAHAPHQGYFSSGIRLHSAAGNNVSGWAWYY